MCGIAGILEPHGRSVDRSELEQMVDRIAHRGPDGRGVHSEGRIGLGHARLSIIDIECGQQPMSTSDGRLWITFNGEIFNYVELRDELISKGHKFRTRSDTEVILHLFEEEGNTCVQRLNGQWAFAIWDVFSERLFLSRDRMGVRPLYYTRTGDRLLFGSEIKALLASPQVEGALDLVALDQIFTFWVTLPPRTAFKNIWQLPPGHSMVVEDGKLNVWRYWQPEYAPESDLTEDREKKAVEELLQLLLDATRIRLRSDVPVGAYLSGGLDSTLITALVRSLRGNDRLATFSITFEDPEYDESGYQEEASRFLGTSHHSVRCTADDIARVFPNVVLHAEQPLLRTAPAPLMLLAELVRNEGYRVVLTGEGADEIFGGYDIFKETKIRRFWGRDLNSRLRPMLLKRLYPYMGGIQQQPFAYLKSFFHVEEDDLRNPFFSHLPRWELTAKLKTFFSDEVRAELNPHAALCELERQLPPSFRSWDPFNQAEYLEAMHLLPGYILSSQGDRVAMASAVEARYPFLDYRIVEFGAKLPPRLKMKVLDQKHLLKEVSDGLVPPSIKKRHKQPYSAPDGTSLLNSYSPLAEDLLSAYQISHDGIFDRRAVTALVSKFKSGRATSTRDNMALAGILSTEILLNGFCRESVRFRRGIRRDVARPSDAAGA